MSPVLFAILAGTVLIAALVRGVIGVGFALIVAPVASLLAPDLVPAVVLLLMVPLNLYVMLRERGAIDWNGARWVTVGRLLGTLFGLLVLALLSDGSLRILVGLATLAAVLATMITPAFVPTRTAFIAAGLVTGVTETATGVGGPPLALVFQHAPGPMLRTSIAACFLFGEVFSLGALCALGRVSIGQIGTAGLLLPWLAVGAFLSKNLVRYVDGPILRSVLLGFALVSGLALLI